MISGYNKVTLWIRLKSPSLSIWMNLMFRISVGERQRGGYSGPIWNSYTEIYTGKQKGLPYYQKREAVHQFTRFYQSSGYSGKVSDPLPDCYCFAPVGRNQPKLLLLSLKWKGTSMELLQLSIEQGEKRFPPAVKNVKGGGFPDFRRRSFN